MVPAVVSEPSAVQRSVIGERQLPYRYVPATMENTESELRSTSLRRSPPCSPSYRISARSEKRVNRRRAHKMRTDVISLALRLPHVHEFGGCLLQSMYVLRQGQIPHDVEERGCLSKTAGCQFLQVLLARDNAYISKPTVPIWTLATRLSGSPSSISS